MYQTYCTTGGTVTELPRTGMNGVNRIPEVSGLGMPGTIGVTNATIGTPVNMVMNPFGATPVGPVGYPLPIPAGLAYGNGIYGVPATAFGGLNPLAIPATNFGMPVYGIHGTPTINSFGLPAWNTQSLYNNIPAYNWNTGVIGGGIPALTSPIIGNVNPLLTGAAIPGAVTATPYGCCPVNAFGQPVIGGYNAAMPYGSYGVAPGATMGLNGLNTTIPTNYITTPTGTAVVNPLTGTVVPCGCNPVGLNTLGQSGYGQVGFNGLAVNPWATTYGVNSLVGGQSPVNSFNPFFATPFSTFGNVPFNTVAQLSSILGAQGAIGATQPSICNVNGLTGINPASFGWNNIGGFGVNSTPLAAWNNGVFNTLGAAGQYNPFVTGAYNPFVAGGCNPFVTGGIVAPWAGSVCHV